MRAASLPLLALPLLLTYCGAKQDLIIGELAPITEAGTAGVSGGGTGAEPGMAGSVTGATGGMGGTAGDTSEGGTMVAAAAGAAGDSGVNCVDGEVPPLGSLIHRYSFDGSGTVAIDTISAADGTLEGGATLDGAGVLHLGGEGTSQHVNLPDRLVSSLTDVTFVVWMTWAGFSGYQRILDFGISSSGVGQGNSGTSYLAVMPRTGFEDQMSPGLGAEIKAAGHPTIHLASKEEMVDRAAQVGFVFRSGVNAELFLDGTLISTAPTEITLSEIDDRNNWIGQSQYTANHNFGGTYDEFRIYNVALTVCQIHTLLVRGPQTP